MSTQVIYIAGPFRASTAWGIAENVRAAERVGLAVAQAGAMPLIPHANTQLFHGLCTDAFWLEGTLELMRRCDGLVMVPGWENSQGATAELAEAGRLGLPAAKWLHTEAPADWSEKLSNQFSWWNRERAL